MVKRKTRFGLTEIVSEHRGQWKKIWMLAVNDLIKKYKGSVMGPLWALIKPSFTLFILWFAFTVGIRNSGMVSGYPRFVFMLSGYIPWFFINFYAICRKEYPHSDQRNASGKELE